VSELVQSFRVQEVAPEQHRIWRALDVLLGFVISGPLVAPLFVASNIAFLKWIALGIIYPLGWLICPAPHLAHYIGSHPMAVCAACYVAIGGLLLMRLTLVPNNHWRRPA
jgi:hypothetical protein